MKISKARSTFQSLAVATLGGALLFAGCGKDDGTGATGDGDGDAGDGDAGDGDTGGGAGDGDGDTGGGNGDGDGDTGGGNGDGDTGGGNGDGDGDTGGGTSTGGQINLGGMGGMGGLGGSGSGGDPGTGGDLGTGGSPPEGPICDLDPADIAVWAAMPTSGLITDLDANLGVVESSGEVSSWTDQSGTGNVLTTTVGIPTYVAGALNGNAIIELSSDKLVGDESAPYNELVNGSGFTWAAVVRVDTQNSSVKNAIFGTLVAGNPWSGITGGVSRGTVDGNSGSPFAMVRRNTDNFATSVTEFAPGTWVIVLGRLSAGTDAQSLEVFVNSVTPEATTPVTISTGTATGQLTIGAEQANGGEYLDGALARLVIFNRPLSDFEMAQLGCRFEVDYGLDTLF